MIDSWKRIFGAFLVGGVLLTSAFLIKNSTIPEESGELSVVSQQSAPRTYIPASDKNADGVPDWQEALQRTEPVLLENIDNSYELPDTLTDQFAIGFFQDVVLSKNYGAFGKDPEQLIKQASDQFNEEARDELFGLSDIKISTTNSTVSYRQYANALARIALSFTLPANAPTELDILKRAYATDNTDVLLELDPIVSGYASMLNQLIQTNVPSEYAAYHLDLANTINAVYNDIKAMQLAFSDPLYTIIRIKRFKEDVSAMQIVILNIQKQMLLDEVRFTESDPVYRLISL